MCFYTHSNLRDSVSRLLSFPLYRVTRSFDQLVNSNTIRRSESHSISPPVLHFRYSFSQYTLSSDTQDGARSTLSE